MMKYKYFPKDNGELNNIVQCLITENGYTVDLNCIDVSNITDMSYLFYNSKFNGDISKWNVSKVMDMGYMFANSEFNGDISKWDMSNVRNTRSMFFNAKFNGDISKWDVSKVTIISKMFMKSKFNKILPNFDFDNNDFRFLAFINSRISFIDYGKSSNLHHKLVNNINLIKII